MGLNNNKQALVQVLSVLVLERWHPITWNNDMRLGDWYMHHQAYQGNCYVRTSSINSIKIIYGMKCKNFPAMEALVFFKSFHFNMDAFS